MAGAGYDISASTSRALTSGLEGYSPSIISFGNSRVSGLANSQGQDLSADSAATNRSPGATNAFSDLSPLERYRVSQGVNVPSNPNIWIVAALAGVALVFFLRD